MSDSATPWTAACQAPLSFIMSQSLLKLMSIELVMPSNHLILCYPLKRVKRYKLHIIKLGHGNVTYSMVTIVNNTVLHIWKLLKLLDFTREKKHFVTMYGKRY